MESFSGERAGYGAVRADEPEIETELLSDGQGEGVAASGDQHDFDAGIMGATQGGQIVAAKSEIAD